MLLDEVISKLPPYKKLLEFSRANGACEDFLRRADKCNSYQEAVEKQNIDLITWFDWLIDYFTAEARAELMRVEAEAKAEYKRVEAEAWAEFMEVEAGAKAENRRVTTPAWAEYRRVEAGALAEYRRVTTPALIQGVISSFNPPQED